MGKYIINYTETAIKDLRKHKKSGNKAVIHKISAIVSELEENPYTGIGKPEQLKHELTGFWSRRISQKDRIVYSVKEDIITVEVISPIGHYNDK